MENDTTSGPFEIGFSGYLLEYFGVSKCAVRVYA